MRYVAYACLSQAATPCGPWRLGIVHSECPTDAPSVFVPSEGYLAPQRFVDHGPSESPRDARRNAIPGETIESLASPMKLTNGAGEPVTAYTIDDGEYVRERAGVQALWEWQQTGRLVVVDVSVQLCVVGYVRAQLWIEIDRVPLEEAEQACSLLQSVTTKRLCALPILVDTTRVKV